MFTLVFTCYEKHSMQKIQKKKHNSQVAIGRKKGESVNAR